MLPNSKKLVIVVITAAVGAAALVSFAEAATIPSSIQQRPNIIVIQPDDHLFLEEWNPPARFEHQTNPPSSLTSILSSTISEESYLSPVPNINRIRNHGLEMTNAYAASSMCGTSRYSTLTGRLPSRSAYGRQIDQNNWNYFNNGKNDDDFTSSFLREVVIPKTKLEDVWGVQDGNDCTSNNLAAILQQNGYSTGVVGKWHLEETEGEDGALYDHYPWVQDKVRNCGFDFAEAIYRENLGGEYNVDGGFVTHNMEHVASEAIRFIQESVGANSEIDDNKKTDKEEETTSEEDKPFFLYFNPTVPHDSGDVTDALLNANCKNTVQGWLHEAPSVPYGMTADFDGCYEYRQSVLERAAASEASMDRDKLAGAVWVDDAIGSLFATLEALDILDNTLILFQLDHGMDAKGSLFEGGSRIVQFIHYPDQIKVESTTSQEASTEDQPQGWKFEGLVSTIDIAPTLMDLAGVPLAPRVADNELPAQKQHRYEMDGKSWFSEMLALNAGSDNETNNIPQKQERQQKSMRIDSYFQERCLFLEMGLDRAVRCGCYKYIYVSDPNTGGTVRNANSQGVYLDNHNYYNLCDENSGNYINSPVSSPELWSNYYENRISDDIKSKLQNKVACLAKQTDPSKAYPDYETDCSLPLHHNQAVSSPGVNGPSVIEVVDNNASDAPADPEWSQPIDVTEDLEVFEDLEDSDPKEDSEPKAPFLRSPSSSSTSSFMADTMPKFGIILLILMLLLTPCFLYWLYREVCRRVVLKDSYRSNAKSRSSASPEQMKEIEESMLQSAIGIQGNRSLVVGSRTIQKTGHEIANQYGSDYNKSSNPMIWGKLADEFKRQAFLRAKWKVYTVSGIVVGSSSNSVATDLTMETSDAFPSPLLESNHTNSDEESDGTPTRKENSLDEDTNDMILGEEGSKDEVSISGDSRSADSSRQDESSGEIAEV